MAGKPMPWFKVPNGYTRIAAISRLTDLEFRVWHELLDEAAQQPKRWRYESLEDAAALVRRPLKVVAALAEKGAIEFAADGVLMLIPSEWQTKYPSDFKPIHSASSPDLLRMDSESDGLSTPLELPPENRDKRIEISTPLSPPQGARKRRAKPEREPLTDEQRERIVAEYAPKLGGESAVIEEIALAMNHEARFKAINEALYVRGWLRREAQRRPTPMAPRTNGYAVSERIGPKVILDD